MRRDEQLRVIKGLMNHLDNGTNVDAGGQVRNPVTTYTDKGMAADEWREFFLNHTQLLGLSGDLPDSQPVRPQSRCSGRTAEPAGAVLAAQQLDRCCPCCD